MSNIVIGCLIAGVALLSMVVMIYDHVTYTRYLKRLKKEQESRDQ